MRGGEISTSDESPRAGFFKTNPYPRPMLALHKEQIQNSLVHQGGPPYWGTHSLPTRLRLGNILLNRVIYPWIHFRRRRRGLPPYQPPPRWKAHVSTIFRDERGHVLWTKSKDQEEWILPGDVSMPNEPPWGTAVRSVKNAHQINMRLTGLSGIYPAADSATIALTFVAGFTSGQPLLINGTETDFFAVGQEPRSARHQHVIQVEDALNTAEEIHFRLMIPRSIVPNS
jgi:hypothetical protein